MAIEEDSLLHEGTGMMIPPLPRGCALRQAWQNGDCSVKGTRLEGRGHPALPAWVLNHS